jgi:Predicted drug exporters of the RND superfamily
VIKRFADAVTGPRGRWVTIAIWLAIGVAGFLAHSHIDDVTAAGQSGFLPRDAESTRALDVLEQSQKSGEEVPVVLVFERNGGLSKADLNAIGRIGDGLDALKITGATPIVDPFSGTPRLRSATWRRSPKASGRSPATAKRRWWCWRSTPATAARSSPVSTPSAGTSPNTSGRASTPT